MNKNYFLLKVAEKIENKKKGKHKQTNKKNNTITLLGKEKQSNLFMNKF